MDRNRDLSVFLESLVSFNTKISELFTVSIELVKKRSSVSSYQSPVFPSFRLINHGI